LALDSVAVFAVPCSEEVLIPAAWDYFFVVVVFADLAVVVCSVDFFAEAFVVVDVVAVFPRLFVAAAVFRVVAFAAGLSHDPGVYAWSFPGSSN
jgi:hypothetical protein